MFRIDEVTNIVVTRREANFDRACDLAIKIAMIKFDVDENGHFHNVKDAKRFFSSIELEFVRYTATGGEHNYEFKAKVTN